MTAGRDRQLKRVNLLFTGLSLSQTAVPLFKTMDYILVFISGFSVCAIVGGTLWFLRECERARAFKVLRDENQWLREGIVTLRGADDCARQIVARVHAGIGQLRREMRFGGKVLLPATAKQVGQHSQIPVKPILSEPSLRGGSDFSGR